MIKHVVGDLLTSDEPVIAHGCNTRGVMGAGIAMAIATTYPEVYSRYRDLCLIGDFVIGTSQVCWVVRPLGTRTAMSRAVINLGTQDEPGANATYWGVFLSFANLFEWARRHDVGRVAIPRIGCGIGGLRWSAVEQTIETVYLNVDGPKIVVYTHPSEEHKNWG